MKRFTYKAIIVFSLFIGAGTVMAQNSSGCDADFFKIIEGGDSNNIAEKINAMKQLSLHCSGTGLYEARLAKLYSLNGQNLESRKILDDSLKKKLPHDKELRITLFSTLLALNLQAEAKTVAVSLVNNYPDWDGGYLSAGQISLVENNFQDGIEYLEHAVALNETIDAYIFLAMAYYETRKYRESVVSMQQALKLGQDAMSHTQAVCAASLSLIALGYRSEAEDLLTRHLKVQPNAERDPVFQQAVSLAIGNKKPEDKER